MIHSDSDTRELATDLVYIDNLDVPNAVITLSEEEFTRECEFVQALGNPVYLSFVHQQGFIEDKDFLLYLRYLRYFLKPEFAPFIFYPHSLSVLRYLTEYNPSQVTFRQLLSAVHQCWAGNDLAEAERFRMLNARMPFGHSSSTIQLIQRYSSQTRFEQFKLKNEEQNPEKELVSRWLYHILKVQPLADIVIFLLVILRILFSNAKSELPIENHELDIEDSLQTTDKGQTELKSVSELGIARFQSLIYQRPEPVASALLNIENSSCSRKPEWFYLRQVDLNAIQSRHTETSGTQRLINYIAVLCLIYKCWTKGIQNKGAAIATIISWKYLNFHYSHFWIWLVKLPGGIFGNFFVLGLLISLLIKINVPSQEKVILAQQMTAVILMIFSKPFPEPLDFCHSILEMFGSGAILVVCVYIGFSSKMSCTYLRKIFHGGLFLFVLSGGNAISHIWPVIIVIYSLIEALRCLTLYLNNEFYFLRLTPNYLKNKNWQLRAACILLDIHNLFIKIYSPLLKSSESLKSNMIITEPLHLILSVGTTAAFVNSQLLERDENINNNQLNKMSIEVISKLPTKKDVIRLNKAVYKVKNTLIDINKNNQPNENKKILNIISSKFLLPQSIWSRKGNIEKNVAQTGNISINSKNILKERWLRIISSPILHSVVFADAAAAIYGTYKNKSTKERTLHGSLAFFVAILIVYSYNISPYAFLKSILLMLCEFSTDISDNMILPALSVIIE